MSKVNLTEIFESCVADMGDNNTARMKFLLEAKKADPEVTLMDCRKVLGMHSEDEKQEANLRQKFSNNILNVVRGAVCDKLLKKAGLSNFTHTDVFANGEKPEELQKIKEEVLDLLPRRTRQTQSKNVDLSFVDSFI